MFLNGMMDYVRLYILYHCDTIKSLLDFCDLDLIFNIKMYILNFFSGSVHFNRTRDSGQLC